MGATKLATPHSHGSTVGNSVLCQVSARYLWHCSYDRYFEGFAPHSAGGFLRTWWWLLGVVVAAIGQAGLVWATGGIAAVIVWCGSYFAAHLGWQN
jgi:hypothetical protein